MPDVPSASRPLRRRVAGAALFLLVVLTMAAVVVPLWLIHPFKPQTPNGLAVAFALRRWAPAGSVVALLVGLALAIVLWRRGRWWSRTLIGLALVPLSIASWAARQNLYERMFVPLDQARFAPAAEASWVADGEAVLALEHHGDAAAYPVRQVAYHHVVQDVVGGVAVAVTY